MSASIKLVGASVWRLYFFLILNFIKDSFKIIRTHTNETGNKKEEKKKG